MVIAKRDKDKLENALPCQDMWRQLKGDERLNL
jgi:hypothetical protein